MIEERITSIEKRAQAATEGPWVAREATSLKYCSWVEVPLFGKDREPTGNASTIALAGRNKVTVVANDLDEQNDNCSFIAHARSDIPYLLQALAASQVRVKELEQASRGMFQREDESNETYQAALAKGESDILRELHDETYDSGLEAAAKIAERRDLYAIAHEIRAAKKGTT